MFHRHIWQIIYTSVHGVVQQCSCGEFQTKMWDYSKKDYVWVPGNFLSSVLGSEPVFICCGTITQFHEALKKILQDNPDIEQNRIVYLTRVEQLKNVQHPVIYFYGEWYEHDICSDHRFTEILNFWR